MISTADASYAEHSDGKCHTAGTVGFESDTSYYFVFVSNKQPVVAKSAGEAELIQKIRLEILLSGLESYWMNSDILKKKPPCT
jgi:hypothetical protein